MVNPFRRFSKFLGLFLLWLLLSGHFTALVVVLGLLSALLVSLLSDKMNLHIAGPRSLRKKSLRGDFNTLLALLRYAIWLGKSIILATIELSCRIWHPKLPIAPHFIKLTLHQHSVLGKVTYANSLSLTPATLTMQLHKNTMHVHALSLEAAQSLRSGEMDRRISALEKC